MTEVPQPQLTPAMLDYSHTLEKGYMWGTKQLLLGESSLVDTQPGCGISDASSILTLS